MGRVEKISNWADKEMTLALGCATVAGAIVVAEVMAATTHTGYNVLTDQIEDLFKAGILDPAKVVIATLTHAASTAGMVLLSEALIVDAD